jgi:orotidine-5'-phosphate decarboxylase
MPKNKLIVALDVNTREDALSLIKKLREKVGGFKIGLELFHSLGPQIIEEIQSLGVRVFYDGKFHDIPNTVSRAVASISQLGIWMLNVHCSGGIEMMHAASKTAHQTSKLMHKSPPLVIGVTILTSIHNKVLNNEMGIPGNIQSTVLRYSHMAKEAELDGVVCSGYEIEMVRKEMGKDFLLVVPGIRPDWSVQISDQKRIMSPKQAMELGADYLVIGRPITQAPDPCEVVKKIIDEIS